MTLRTRLTLGLIVLAAAGLVATDVASYMSLRGFLVGRIDDSLTSAFRSLTTELPVGKTQGVSPATITTYEGGVIPGDCVQVRQLEGALISSRCLKQYGQATFPPAPRYPRHLGLPAAPSPLAGSKVRFFTVAAVRGGERYRVRASIEKGQPNYALLIATPLTGVDGTLHRLLVIELIVTTVVLLALGGLALWLVRLGLKPLVAIGDTARAIAGGDYSRRIEHADERTEIGRLGQLLNTMLGQIESAFQAREASELKLRRFVADASHELRTPVQAIRAYADLLSRAAAAGPEDLDRSIAGVRQASERMSTLVDELFLLAHLDEGRPLAREPVELDDVVAEAVELARALEPGRPVGVETVPTSVLGDRSRLRQLVDNLLANARAHTPPETPVAVGLTHAGGNAVLRVSDRGPGIGPESLPHVFERFYRADDAHARGGTGSGLGLAIVLALAEAHGGSAVVSSRRGEGATFTVTLPLAAPGHPTEPEQAGREDAEPVGSRTLRNAGNPQALANRDG